MTQQCHVFESRDIRPSYGEAVGESSNDRPTLVLTARLLHLSKIPTQLVL